MEASKLKEILDQHQLWLETNRMQGQRAILTGADLTGAYLCGANLEGADLTGADLTGADLYCASLKGADLGGADLTSVDFTSADLYDASLVRANLSRANLHGADLTGADLYHASLKDANLGGADLTSADLTSADLKDTIGLPDVSWIIPGCLAQLNKIGFGFYLEKEGKSANFIQDSFGLIIQNNGEEDTFDMLIEDKIIRSIPNWVKYSGLKQL